MWTDNAWGKYYLGHVCPVQIVFIPDAIKAKSYQIVSWKVHLVFGPNAIQANSPLTITFRPNVFQAIYYLGQMLIIKSDMTGVNI